MTDSKNFLFIWYYGHDETRVLCVWVGESGRRLLFWGGDTVERIWPSLFTTCTSICFLLHSLKIDISYLVVIGSLSEVKLTMVSFNVRTIKSKMLIFLRVGCVL